MRLVSTSEKTGQLVRWPLFNDQDRQALLRVLASQQLVNGAESRLLEQEWANFVGIRHCIAVSSCTHAIHLALCALGIGPGDDVLVPALTFCGTVNPIMQCGATPVFTDVLMGTYELDPLDAAAKRSSRTKAVVPVHVHGMPCDMRRLALALPDLPIIEDACQAHGAEVDGRKAGALGTIGCFSLNQVKPLPAGQGGLIVTDSDSLAERLRALVSHGSGTIIGWSYGITEFAAALARSQLSRLSKNNEKGRENARRFTDALDDFSELMPATPSGRLPVWHKFRVMLPPAISQEGAMNYLREQGVQVENWPGKVVPDLDAYRSRFAGVCCPVARHVAAQSIVIGSEPYPLAAQRPEVVTDWANALRRLLAVGMPDSALGPRWPAQACPPG